MKPRTSHHRVSLAPFFYAILLLLLPTLTHSKRFTKDRDAVLLSDIQALTFHADRDTAHRRVSAIPQLTCIAGSGCPHYTPDTIRCTASGSSYSASDIEWTCTASLPPEFKLGSTDVVCEGYDGPDDDYVLKGSCGLEYRLVLTELGRQKYSGGSGGGGGSASAPASKSNEKKAGGEAPSADYHQLLQQLLHDRESKADERKPDGSGGFGSSLANILFWAAFLAILILMLRAVWRENRNEPNARRRPAVRDNGSGWGSNDDDDNDDPPPPYSPAPAKKKRTYTARSSTTRQTSNASQGWRPGFWTGTGVGTAAGAAAGYAAGSMRNQGGAQTRTQAQAQTQPEMQHREYDAGVGSSRRPDAGSYGGGGGGGYGGGAAYSGARYESTGFGGTRRR